MNRYMNKHRVPSGQGRFHTHVGMMEGCKGIFALDREGFEKLWNIHCDATYDKPNYLCGIAEKPQNFSMLRSDIDQKEETTKTQPYEMYSIFDALTLIKEIQEYLKENVVNCKSDNLHCALLTKDPYLSVESDGKTYNKNGFHLQFINCFLSKEDNKRLAKHFHSKNKTYDDCTYYAPWLLYGSKKKATTGKYSVTQIVLHNGSFASPEEYFKSYKIFDDRERQIKFTKPIPYYYPRIFSILSYGRDNNLTLKLEMLDTEVNKIDYFQLQENSEDFEQYGDEIEEIIQTYIQEELNDAVVVREVTERGYKLKNTGTFTCPIDPQTTHCSRGAYFNIRDGGIYFGCFKPECREANNGRATVLVGRYRNSIYQPNTETETKSDTESNTESNTETEKLVFQEVMSIPKNKRTKEQNEFMDQIFSNITKRNIEYLFNVKGALDPHQTYDPSHQDKKGYKGMTYAEITAHDREFAMWMVTQRTRHSPIFSNCLYPEDDSGSRVEIKEKGWVSKDIFTSEERCTVVKSGLGSGKTQASTDHINESKYEQIVVYTPRRSYARCCLDRLKTACPQHDWLLYLDAKARIMNHPYVICQAESLHRVDFKQGKKTLVLIDEVEAFLCQLTSNLHKENHVRNIETFIQCMQHASKIICLDAFISQRTLQTMKLLKIPYKFFDYTHPVQERSCVKTESVNDLLIRLNTDLTDGKKIFFFCSSITKLREEFIPTLEKAFPDKKIIQYHSDTKTEVKALNNVNRVWKDADLVITTSTITVGCNYDTQTPSDQFHKAYCYAGATSKNVVRDMFQALYRARYLLDNELVYCVDPRHYGQALSTSKNQIQKSLKDKTELIEKQYQEHNMGHINKTPEWLSELIAYNNFEYNVGIMNLEELFQRYLKECNYVHTDSNESELLLGIEFEEFTKPEIAYKDIPSMNSDQMKDLRKKRVSESLSDLENAMWEKFWFQHCVLELPKDVEQPMWEIYCNFNKGKFRNLCVEKGIEQGTVRIQDLLDCNNYSALQDGFSLRTQVINDIKTWLGMVNTQQYGYKITREKVESVLENFKNNKQNIHTVFELNKDRSQKFDVQTCQKLINKVFLKWGFSQMKKKGRLRKQVDGKRVDVTPFVIENDCVDDDQKECQRVIDVYKYIKPKFVAQRDPVVTLSTSAMPLL